MLRKLKSSQNSFDRKLFATDVRDSAGANGSIRSIAAKSGVTLSVVQNILHGNTDMRVSTFFALCATYDLNPSDYCDDLNKMKDFWTAKNRAMPNQAKFAWFYMKDKATASGYYHRDPKQEVLDIRFVITDEILSHLEKWVEAKERTVKLKIFETGGKEYNEAINQIVSYLNDKADTGYRANTKQTRDLIIAKLRVDYTVQDFFRVIDTKVAEWGDTENDKFLRPATLFGGKFESYLNQKPMKKEKDLSKASMDGWYE